MQTPPLKDSDIPDDLVSHFTDTARRFMEFREKAGRAGFDVSDVAVAKYNSTVENKPLARFLLNTLLGLHLSSPECAKAFALADQVPAGTPNRVNVLNGVAPIFVSAFAEQAIAGLVSAAEKIAQVGKENWPEKVTGKTYEEAVADIETQVADARQLPVKFERFFHQFDAKTFCTNFSLPLLYILDWLLNVWRAKTSDTTTTH
jgi:hypothetical protein